MKINLTGIDKETKIAGVFDSAPYYMSYLDIISRQYTFSEYSNFLYFEKMSTQLNNAIIMNEFRLLNPNNSSFFISEELEVELVKEKLLSIGVDDKDIIILDSYLDLPLNMKIVDSKVESVAGLILNKKNYYKEIEDEYDTKDIAGSMIVFAYNFFRSLQLINKKGFTSYSEYINFFNQYLNCPENLFTQQHIKEQGIDEYNLKVKKIFQLSHKVKKLIIEDMYMILEYSNKEKNGIENGKHYLLKTKSVEESLFSSSLVRRFWTCSLSIEERELYNKDYFSKTQDEDIRKILIFSDFLDFTIEGFSVLAATERQTCCLNIFLNNKAYKNNVYDPESLASMIANSHLIIFNKKNEIYKKVSNNYKNNKTEHVLNRKLYTKKIKKNDEIKELLKRKKEIP